MLVMLCFCVVVSFFFFKQKTAYELRISDWSSDVCSSDLIALDAITRQQATFTRRDLAQFAFRHSDGKDQFDQVMSAVRTSPELVALGKDGRGEDRFTSRDMIDTEQRLSQAGDR